MRHYNTSNDKVNMIIQYSNHNEINFFKVSTK